jgi:GTP cyclohydrolase III
MLETLNETACFYGLDGDKIESAIEACLIQGEIDVLRSLSERITSTLEEITQKVIEKGGKVIYCAGDNILFYGQFSNRWCEEMIDLFRTRTGQTASIGIGNTSTEFFLALKLAKSLGGRQVIRYKTSYS